MLRYCSISLRRNFLMMKLILSMVGAPCLCRLFDTYYIVRLFLEYPDNSIITTRPSNMSPAGLLTKIVKYSHISMLKKYNFQNHNRYKSADKFIAAHNYEHIKNYKDFCTKPNEVDQVQLTLSEEEQEYLKSVFLYQRKSVAWTKQLGPAPYRMDDKKLQAPIQNKTLISFMKQGLKQRKPHQMLLFYIIGAAIINSWLYFGFWYGTDRDDYVANRTLNPEFMETFNLANFQPYVKEYKRKMGVQLEEIMSKPSPTPAK